MIEKIIDWLFEFYYLWAKGEDYKSHIHYLIPLLYQYDHDRATEIWDKATASFSDRNNEVQDENY